MYIFTHSSFERNILPRIARVDVYSRDTLHLSSRHKLVYSGRILNFKLFLVTKSLKTVFKFFKASVTRYALQTIMLKMVDQEWSDVYVVFTMSLCSLNFCVWYVMCLILFT